MRSPEGRHAGNEPAKRGTGRCGVAPRRRARRASRGLTPDCDDGACDLGVREEGAENGEPEIQAPRGHRASRLGALAGVRVHAEDPGHRALQAKVDDRDCPDLYPRSPCAASVGPQRTSNTRCAKRRLGRARTRLGPSSGGMKVGIRRLQGRRGIGRGEHERRRRSPHGLRRASRCAGALAYKAVNTLDSMVGYRQPPYEDLRMGLCPSGRSRQPGAVETYDAVYRGHLGTASSHAPDRRSLRTVNRQPQRRDGRGRIRRSPWRQARWRQHVRRGAAGGACARRWTPACA